MTPVKTKVIERLFLFFSRQSVENEAKDIDINKGFTKSFKGPFFFRFHWQKESIEPITQDKKIQLQGKQELSVPKISWNAFVLWCCKFYN